ncbi:ABC transporter substrate-binding protein [Microbacterium murale]|uniref:ABC-type Fe3+-hydroxamate transport system substrate-binding protein n=1 Tax=Microbacterium murale TaxID=1081040 RepID=A0ABU0P995_9MICO|nr:iron-siderophore ABC transporter substrate-binding protein [Microbacterium murale]MDQ0643904.1 ABC-type Fe3+-hydroxamate transport system substrate-binding protein [Microbacterium murale]
MKKTQIATLASISILALALSGCGTTEVAPQDSAAPESVASEDCAADETSTSADPVTLTDDFGRTVELDKPAERVAVLEWQQIEDTLTLCVTPVAVADAEGYTTWDTAEVLPEGVVDVGTRQEPNLDALFATNPDLVIVEASGPDDEIIAQLEAYDVPVIATIGADAADPIAKMLATFDLIAQATGREERADVVKDEFDAYLADAKGELADADLPTTDFVFFDGWVDGGNVALRPYGQGSLIGELGEELGLTNAWTGEVDAAYGLGQTDIEGMLAIGDATLLHTGTVGDDSDEFLAALDGNSIWKTVPAVAQERIYSFPAGIWTFGGPRSAQQIIDAYVAALSK